MNSYTMGRRALLGGAAATMAWLASGRGRADRIMTAEPAPTRFVVFFTPNGTVRDRWLPSGGETDFSLSPILSPLARHRRRLAVIDGLDMRSTENGPGDGHQKGMGHMLTGTSLLTGSGFDGQGAPDAGWGGGPSIDQVIASQIGGSSSRRSIELGVLRRGGVGGTNANVWNRMCYSAAGAPLAPIDDPALAFDRLFGGTSGDEARRRLRRSVLDTATADLASLRGRVGATDRLRLDAHLTALREIEARIDGTHTCAPTPPPSLDAGSYTHMPEVGRAQMDLLAAALGCGVTRVASLQWTESVGTAVFPWLGLSDADSHHHLSHCEPTPDLRVRFVGESDADYGAYVRSAQREKLARIDAWFAEQLAYLVDRLEALPEGDGSVMDRTCILWINELGDGQSHSHTSVPIVLVGSAGGALRNGCFLQLGGRPHNDLLLTLAQAYGVAGASFGDPRHVTGPITELGASGASVRTET